MIAGDGALHFAVDFFHRERVDIDGVKLALHAEEEDFIRRIYEVSRSGGEPRAEQVRIGGANVAARVDEIRAEDELVRFGVDHPVGVRAADALGMERELEVGADGVKSVVTARGRGRRIGEPPQSLRPRHERADATFTGGIEDGEMRINAVDFDDFVARRRRPRLTLWRLPGHDVGGRAEECGEGDESPVRAHGI